MLTNSPKDGTDPAVREPFFKALDDLRALGKSLN